MRLHAESGGIRQVTSNGDHTTHIQNGDWKMQAEGDVMFESKTGVVRLQTNGGKFFVEPGPTALKVSVKEIVLLAGMKVDFTGGPVSGKASANAGNVEGLVYFGKMEVLDVAAGFALVDETGTALVGQPYTLKTNDGRIFEGVTDSHGHTQMPADAKSNDVEITLGHSSQPKEAE
jgi:uncharacterized protein (DUF2345 family)